MTNNKRYFNSNGQELELSWTTQGILVNMKDQPKGTMTAIALITQKELDNFINEGDIIIK
jgi:hypothetical protein